MKMGMKKSFTLLLVVALCLGQLCGCAQREGRVAVNIYRLGPQEQGGARPILSERVEIEDAPLAEEIVAVTARLLRPDGASRLESPFPAGVTILSHELDGDLLTLDFSAGYADLPIEKQLLADACTVLTFTAITGVQAVRLQVDGQPHPTFGMRYFVAADFLTREEALSPVGKDITLYFMNSEKTALRAETRYIRILGGDTPERFVVSELLKGPESADLISPIPENTVLISAFTEKRICYVNLSEEFVLNRNDFSIAGTMTVYSIVNSLADLSSVDSVQILIDGREVRDYFGTTIDAPLMQDESLVEQ